MRYNAEQVDRIVFDAVAQGVEQQRMPLEVMKYNATIRRESPRNEKRSFAKGFSALLAAAALCAAVFFFLPTPASDEPRVAAQPPISVLSAEETQLPQLTEEELLLLNSGEKLHAALGMPLLSSPLIEETSAVIESYAYPSEISVLLTYDTPYGSLSLRYFKGISVSLPQGEEAVYGDLAWTLHADDDPLHASAQILDYTLSLKTSFDPSDLTALLSTLTIAP